MEKYAPASMELAPRDIVARVIQQEIEEGREFKGGCFLLDLRCLKEKKLQNACLG